MGNKEGKEHFSVSHVTVAAIVGSALVIVGLLTRASIHAYGVYSFNPICGGGEGRDRKNQTCCLPVVFLALGKEGDYCWRRQW